MASANTHYFYKFILICLAILSIGTPVLTQSGGPYVMLQSVIAGGGSDGSGGQYSICGTAGQSVAGQPAANSSTSVHAGFWNSATSMPTAGSVSVSGKILTPDGRGLRNALVVITDSHRARRTVTTSSFGFYAFYDVAVGESYVISVSSKLYRFSARTIQVMDTAANVDFVGLE